MKASGALVLVFAVLIPVLVAVAAAPGPAVAADAPDGKAIFLAQKCNLCHSVEPAGIERTSKSEKTKGPDIAGVAKRHDAEWLKRWLNKQELVNGKKHLGPFKGTPQEMDTLIAWMNQQ